MPADVLDVACGHGRHMQFLSGLGHKVLGVDRNAQALQTASQWGETLLADIENAAWPLESRRFKAVVVTNYLHRPLMPALLDAIAPGGVLIYETFAMGNEKFGRPSNPDFLLAPGELLEAVRGRCQVIAFEDVHVQMPKPAMVQRICARRYT